MPGKNYRLIAILIFVVFIFITLSFSNIWISRQLTEALDPQDDKISEQSPQIPVEKNISQPQARQATFTKQADDPLAPMKRQKTDSLKDLDIFPSGSTEKIHEFSSPGEIFVQ